MMNFIFVHASGSLAVAPVPCFPVLRLEIAQPQPQLPAFVIYYAAARSRRISTFGFLVVHNFTISV